MTKHIVRIPNATPEQIAEYQNISECSVIEGTLVAEFSDSRNIEIQKGSLIADLAALRWENTQTFTYDNILTGANKALHDLTATILVLQYTPEVENVKWKMNETTFKNFTYQELVDFSKAIRNHIQACFEHEAILLKQIKEATLDNIDEIDIYAGWPV